MLLDKFIVQWGCQPAAPANNLTVRLAMRKCLSISRSAIRFFTICGGIRPGGSAFACLAWKGGVKGSIGFHRVMNGSNKLSNWMQRTVDSSRSFLVGQALQRATVKYGRMLKLHIDSRLKTLECAVHLKGETEPFTLLVQQYEIVTDAGGTSIVIHKATATREWLATVLEDFVHGRRIPVPEKYVGILRMIA